MTLHDDDGFDSEREIEEEIEVRKTEKPKKEGEWWWDDAFGTTPAELNARRQAAYEANDIRASIWLGGRILSGGATPTAPAPKPETTEELTERLATAQEQGDVMASIALKARLAQVARREAEQHGAV